MSAPSSADAPWPVRTVARKIAEWVGRLGEVWVEGQVTQLADRRSGSTVFLVLRDPSADISLAVTCRRDVLPPGIADGARVVLRARPDFYVGRGSLSLRATEVRAVGIGELLARLQALQALLAAEGLFDAARKRPLPFLPARVGLVTGRASAAERDVVQTARTRWPAVDIRVLNCAVQGPTAAAEVREAVRTLDRDATISVIVVARGGGSVEDLLPFSDESLCRAVSACRTPVVSAIGHEPDSPLLDFVADVRASTPTDAGKRVVPDVAEEHLLMAGLRQRSGRAARRLLGREREWLAATASRPSLARPTQLIAAHRTDVTRLAERGTDALGHRMRAERADVAQLTARVLALSPAATLSRGYAVLTTDDGDVVGEPAQVRAGQQLRARVAGGTLTVRVQP